MGKMNKFVWSDFGILERASDGTAEGEDESYYYIYNSEGDWRIIHKGKYASSLPYIMKKVALLRGKPVRIRTSQNTADWSPDEWFSDITIDKKSFAIPQAVASDSNPVEYESAKRQLGESEQAEKLRQLETALEEEREGREKDRKKFSDDYDSVKAENRDLQAANANLERRISERDAQAREEAEDEIQKDIEYLQGLNLLEHPEQRLTIRRGRSIQTLTHAEKALARRVGCILPEGMKKLNVRILSHQSGNKYVVALRRHNDEQCIAMIGGNKQQGLFVRSFENIDKNYYKAFKKVQGEEDDSYKEEVMSLEQCLEIYKEVKKEMDG